MTLVILALSTTSMILLQICAAEFSSYDSKASDTDINVVSGSVVVHGYCYYQNDLNAQRPIKYATVNLWDKTWYGVSRLLSSTSTNSIGYYSFDSISNVDEPGGSGTLDPYIEVVCDSDAVRVVPMLPINVWPYAGSSDVIWDVPDGTTSIDYTYDDSGTKGCWGIYDSILMAYQKTADTQGYYPRKTTVVWPWIGTHFADLWILQYIGIENGYEWNRDVVLHEYGHWIMHCLYQGNVASVDYGSDGVHYWDSKETAETAWVEGWASFYACAVQDDRYFGLGSVTYDLESQQPKGDDVEGAIACILWDIYDSSNDGNDTLSLGLSPIWDILASYVPGHHVTSIHEFWNGWFAGGFNQSQKMSAIFYDHGVPKDAVSFAAISEVNYPYYVTLGGTADIVIRGENLGGQADEGYLHVSFPDNLSEVEIVDSSASHSQIYWPGTQLWAAYGQYKITATYPHVEAWEAPWPSGGSRYLEVEVTPKSVGICTFYVKMTLGTTGVWYSDPSIDGSESQLKDEQNEYVWSYGINVTTEPPTQYYLTVSSAYGTAGGQGWYDNGTTAYASLDSGKFNSGNDMQHVFTNWSEDASGTDYSQSNPIIMTSTKTAMANWKTQYKVTFTCSGLDSSAVGTVVTVNGEPKTFALLPYSLWVDDADLITYSFGNVSSSTAGKRFISTGVTSPSSPATISQPTVISCNFKIQYQITLDEVGVGLDFSEEVATLDEEDYTTIKLPSVNWFDSGSQHSFAFSTPLDVSADRLYAWTSTSGLSTLQDGNLIVTMPGSIIGHYDYQVQIIVEGNSFNVSTATNSTISDFSFDSERKTITLAIGGTTGTTGFCKIAIPSSLLWGGFSVYKDGMPCTDYTQTFNETHNIFDFYYNHSIHTLAIRATEIVPEFPSSRILLLSMLIMPLILIVYGLCRLDRLKRARSPDSVELVRIELEILHKT